MTTRGMECQGRATVSRRAWAAWGGAALLSLAGCFLGPPPMAPLTETTLAAARRLWDAHGSDSYRLVVRVRPPRADPDVYEVSVESGRLVGVERNGERIRLEEARHEDYSVRGLFELLQTDLRWTAVDIAGDTPAIDLRAQFEVDTGRLVRYRRTVGTARRRVLVVEVLAYEPVATLQLSSNEGATGAASSAP